ncbi:MAG: hypothetical protein WBB25_00945 [Sulfitobacter sp.]
MNLPFNRTVARLLAILLVAGLPLAVTAQHQHTQMPQTADFPSEPGQGAFAALAEIAKLLNEDPTTDWEKVDMDALRVHLVDMSQLVLSSEVVQTAVPDGIRINIDLGRPENAAAGRMVPAHAPVLAAETSWDSDVTAQGDTLIWTVTSPEEQARINALGFYGLMATGDHHRAHHLALARGGKLH